MRHKGILSLFIAAFTSAILYCVGRPVIQDYIAYSLHWDHILSGGNPWIGTSVSNAKGPNGYGPLYNLFAIPYSVYSKLPRIIWALFWFALAYWLITQAFASNRLTNRLKLLLSLILLLSPFLWLRTVHFGQFDVVVAALSLFAIEAKRRDRSILAGILVSLAMALKYYPVVIVPFLSISERKLDLKFIASFVISSIVIFSVAYFMWGETVMIPLKMASARWSKLLSIFRFLRGRYSPLKLYCGINDVDSYSIPLLILAGGGLFVVYLVRQMDFVTGSVLAITVTFASYKLGHQQLHVTLYLLLVYWIICKGSLLKIPATAVIIYMFFINLFDVGYYTTNWYQGDWYFVRDICGLPAFVIMVFMFYAIFRYEALARPEVNSVAAKPV